MTFPPSIPIGAMSSMFTPASPSRLAASATVPGLSSSLASTTDTSRKAIPALVQRTSHAGLIGRVEGRAAAVADPETDDVREVDPALGDRARMARELAWLVGRFNDEPLHGHLLWRHRARLLPAGEAPLGLRDGSISEQRFACCRPSSEAIVSPLSTPLLCRWIRQAKKSVILCVSSENAQRSTSLPSRTCMISAVR